MIASHAVASSGVKGRTCDRDAASQPAAPGHERAPLGALHGEPRVAQVDEPRHVEREHQLVGTGEARERGGLLDRGVEQVVRVREPLGRAAARAPATSSPSRSHAPIARAGSGSHARHAGPSVRSISPP